MKKATGILLILGLLGAGGYFLIGLFSRPYPEKIFPRETIAYLSLHSVKEARENLERTQLVQELQKSPRRSTYEHQISRLFSILESMTGTDLRALLKQFEKDIAVAAFPVKSGQIGTALIAYVTNEEETAAFFERKLDPNLKRRFPDLRKDYVPYEGITYYRYSSKTLPPGATPGYYLNGHHLAVAYTEESLRVLIDVGRKKRLPLESNRIFEDARKRIGYKRGILLFLDAENAMQMFRSSIPAVKRDLWESLFKIAGARAVESFAYRISVKETGFEERGLLSVKPEREGLLKIYLEQKPQKLSVLQSIPSDARVLNASTMADLAKMWDEINAQLKNVLPPDDYQRWQKGVGLAKTVFNFDLRRDLLEPLGNEYAFAYEPGEIASDPSKTKLLLILQLRNPSKFQETVDRLVALASLRGVEKQQEDYHGKRIQVLRLSIGNLSASPAMLLDGSRFFFSTDGSFLKKAIDAGPGGKTIASLQDYQKATAGFPDRVNGLSYTSVQAYLQMYSSILRKKMESDQNRWIREYGVQEEFDVLGKVLSGAASYTEFEKDGIYFYSNTSIPTPFLVPPALISVLPEIMERYPARKSFPPQ